MKKACHWDRMSPMGNRMHSTAQEEFITETERHQWGMGAYAALEDLITGTECHQWELKCMGQIPYPVTRVTTHS